MEGCCFTEKHWQEEKRNGNAAVEKRYNIRKKCTTQKSCFACAVIHIKAPQEQHWIKIDFDTLLISAIINNDKNMWTQQQQTNINLIKTKQK